MNLSTELSRKITIGFLLVFILALSGGLAAGASDKVTLEIWDVYTRKAKSEVMDTAIKQFEQKHPNIKIKRTTRPIEDTKAATMPAVNSGEGPDILTVNNGETMMGPLVRGGHIKNLTPYAEEYGWEQKLFSEKIFNRCKYTPDGKVFGKGNLYALGASGEIVGIFYNKDMFERLDITVPKSLPQLEAAFEKLRGAGKIPLAYGGLEKWPFFHLFGAVSQSILAKNIGANAAQDYLDDIILSWDADRTWDNGSVRETAALLQEWVRKDYFSQGFSGLSIDDAKSMFVAGQAGMFLQGNWYSSGIASADFEAGFIPFPPVRKENPLPPQVGGVITPVGTSEYSDHPDLAAEFLNLWTTSDVVAEERIKYKVLPGKVPVDLSEIKSGSLYYDLAKTWNRVLKTGRMGHYFDWATSTMWDTMGNAGDKLLALKSTPAEFAKTLEKDYRKWMNNKPK